MSTWVDPAITEASGLAYSLRTAYLAYVHNDENGSLFAVDLKTGKTVGKIGIEGHALTDPESIDIDSRGILWWADIGDNDENRSAVAVYTRGEPGRGFRGDQPWTRYVLKYPGGTPHNAETFINWPNGKRQIVSKVASGVVYQLPTTLKAGATNTLSAVHGPDSDLAFVSDAVVSRDGKWVFVLRQGQLSTVFVFDATWTQVGTISMPAMVKPEGIGIQQDGKVLWVCDDAGAAHGHYQAVKIPGTWCPPGAKHYDDGSTVTPPAPPAPAPPVNPCAA